MLQLREYIFPRYTTVVPLMIPDGWRPLCVREGTWDGEAVLVALVDSTAKECAEIFHLLRPILDFPVKPGVEFAFLGHAYQDRYVFLEVPEAEPTDADLGRRIGRLDIPR